MKNVADLGVWSVSGTRSVGLEIKMIGNHDFTLHSFVIFT